MNRELAAFVEVVGGNKKKKIPNGEDVLAAMKIVEKIYKNNHARIGR